MNVLHMMKKQTAGVSTSWHEIHDEQIKLTLAENLADETEKQNRE